MTHYHRFKELPFELSKEMERACSYAQSPSTKKEAEQLFNQIIEAKPDYTGAHFQLGLMYLSFHFYKEAEIAFQKVTEIDPDYFGAYFYLGKSCLCSGNLPEAERSYREALRLQPDDYTCHFQLARAIEQSSYYQKKRQVEAQKHFRMAFELNPDDLVARELGDNLVLHLHDFESAAIFAEQIEELFPEAAKHIRLIISLNRRR